MNITLKAGERFFLNGAVIRLDRKATLELLNDATFLLESHVLQLQDANTPLRQIYFAIQVALMEPRNSEASTRVARQLIASSLAAFSSPTVLGGLRSADAAVAKGRCFEALKTIRGLYAQEDAELKVHRDPPPRPAAA